MTAQLVQNYFNFRVGCCGCGGGDRLRTPAIVATREGPLCDACAAREAPDLHRAALDLERRYWAKPGDTECATHLPMADDRWHGVKVTA